MTAASVEDLRTIVERALVACSVPLPDAAGEGGDQAALMSLTFDEIGFDSLNFMEFCIAISMDVGIELSVDQVTALKTPEAVIAHLSRQA
jgi:acyl carrier protein